MIKRYTSLDGLTCFHIDDANNPCSEYNTEVYIELEDCLESKGNGLFVIGKNQREMVCLHSSLMYAINYARSRCLPLCVYNKHNRKHNICKQNCTLDKRGVNV